jgi:hypothetical protein
MEDRLNSLNEFSEQGIHLVLDNSGNTLHPSLLNAEPSFRECVQAYFKTTFDEKVFVDHMSKLPGNKLFINMECLPGHLFKLLALLRKLISDQEPLPDIRTELAYTEKFVMKNAYFRKQGKKGY